MITREPSPRFRILEYAGEPPQGALSGLKDTVQVPPGETVSVAKRFSDYADPSTPHMFHERAQPPPSADRVDHAAPGDAAD